MTTPRMRMPANRHISCDRPLTPAFAMAALTVLLLLAASPAAFANVDADAQNVVTLNQVDNAGNEIPITTGGVRTVSYDTTRYTLQDQGEAQRTGCDGFGNRTAWVRFVPGVRGRLSVTANAAYDVMLFSYFTSLKRGQTAFDAQTLVTDNCNNATSGPNELNMPVPWDSMVSASSRLEPGQTVLLQSASWCSANSAGCSGGAGGPTTLSVNFIPDDGDNDGVPDTLDQCAGTAGPAAHDGCPDSDNDGIRDMHDACPDQGGPAAVGGCPDRDSDAVRDIDDACPDAGGPAALGGCPDADGDSVRDINDNCPTVPGAAQNGGCPLDGDGDGVPDATDACPDVRGITADGCPDRDGDAIKDSDDACPDVAGSAEKRGCPSDRDGDGVIDAKDRCPAVAGNGPDGCPRDIGATFPYRVAVSGSRSQLRSLKVRAPVGARVEVRCVGRCVLKGKKLQKKRRVLVAKKRTTDLLRLFGSRTLVVMAGSRIEIRVTQARALGNIRTMTFRRKAGPRIVDRCLTAQGRRTTCT